MLLMLAVKAREVERRLQQRIVLRLGRLAGHSMFAAPGALDRLRMCADCRVIDMMKNESGTNVRDR